MERNIEITNWKTDEVIFSYACENNTITKTLEEAVKQGVSLAYADLRGANLAGANLSYANLNNANLFGADLSFTNLSDTNLSYSNLKRTELFGTNLSYANLSNVQLSYVNLDDTYFFYNAILDNVKGLNDKCPKEGSFIGWKICYINHRHPYKCCLYIVKLEIPEDAKRSSSTTNRCRCSKAKVLDIQKLNGTKADVDIVYSGYDKNFKYKVGEIVEVPDFDERYWKECSRGIHFFMNKEDAIKY